MSVLTRPSVVATLVAAAISTSASANLIAAWTMPTAFPSGAGNVPTGTSYVPPMLAGEPAGQADSGANRAGSQLSSVHQLAAATYTSPAGNGSQHSFSSNNWKAGDYYEARVSTLGFTDGINIQWDQARSSTGAKFFELIMSVDGGANWSTLIASYEVLQSGGGGAPGTWSSTTYNPIYTNLLQGISAASDQSEVIFRFVALVDAVSSTTGAYAASGSVRIDNVTIFTPTPGAVALIGLAGVAARRRRA
jgi:hypothetical protein